MIEFMLKRMLINKNDKSNDIYFNIDVKIILIDANFFRRQNLNVFIRKIIFSLTIRELNITQHLSANYVIILMYFSSTKKRIFFRNIDSTRSAFDSSYES